VLNHPKYGPTTQRLDQVMVCPNFKKYFFSRLLTKINTQTVILPKVGFRGPIIYKLARIRRILSGDLLEDLSGSKTSKYDVKTPCQVRNMDSSILKKSRKFSLFSTWYKYTPGARVNGKISENFLSTRTANPPCGGGGFVTSELGNFHVFRAFGANYRFWRARTRARQEQGAAPGAPTEKFSRIFFVTRTANPACGGVRNVRIG
jgi:hypothetical protein